MRERTDRRCLRRQPLRTFTLSDLDQVAESVWPSTSQACRIRATAKRTTPMFQLGYMFSPEQRAYQRDARDALARLAPRYEALTRSRHEIDVRPLLRDLASSHSLAPHWPEKFGGAGKSPVEMALLAEALVDSEVPELQYFLSIVFVGSILLADASDEQKDFFLPRLARGQTHFSILYSEKDAGSDLFSLAATATEVRPGLFRLRGEKLYNMKSTQSDYALGLFQTDPKKGADSYSIFIVPLSSGAVDVDVVPTQSKEQFNRVCFRDLVVSDAQIVGQRGKGWSILSRALPIERTGLDYYLKAKRWFRLLQQLCDEHCISLSPHELAEKGALEQRIAAAKVLSYQIIGDAEHLHALDSLKTCSSKYLASELAVDVAAFARSVLSSARLRVMSSRSMHALDELHHAHLEAPGLTLSAGSSELLLDIISREIA